MRRHALAAAILLALPAALPAQVDVTRAGIITGAEFRTVSFGDGATRRLSEFAVPVGFAAPLGRRATFDIGTYYVSAQRKDDAGATSTISGLTDVVVRTAVQLKQDVAVLTVSANLPTGQHELTTAQNVVAGNFATDLVPFPVSNFGSGFSVTSGLALAAPVGPWALGLAGSYRFNGSYTPFADTTTTLKPGGEVRMRLGADRIVGQGRVSLGLTYSTFSNDEYGSAARRPGARIIPQASWSLPMGNNNLAIYAWDVYRRPDNVSGSVSENTTTLGAVLAIRAGRNSLRPLAEFRYSTKGGESNGTLVGLGARYVISASQRLSISPGFRLDLGSVPLVAGSSTTASLTGLSGSITIRGSL